MRAFLPGLLLMLLPVGVLAADAPPPGLAQAISYSYPMGLVAAAKPDRIAWITVEKGVRTVWTAAAPTFRPVRLGGSSTDDGQELSWLSLSPDGSRAVWVRGGDHDANWPTKGEPNPANGSKAAALEIWSATTSGGPATKIAEGDAPVISPSGRVAFVKEGQVWAIQPARTAKPEQLIADRGRASGLAWSPDGLRLAFVSGRGDHAFVGIWSGPDRPIVWLAPSTGFDGSPVWSPDGTRVAFVRRPGGAGAPIPFLTETAQPWSIVVADAVTGEGAAAWRSPRTVAGSFPDSISDGAALMWAAGDRLVFRAELDGWPHLYSVAASGGEATLLTPGEYMVEHAVLSRDRASVLYDANSGPAVEDDDRRHLFRVPVDRAGTITLTKGEGLEWTPAELGGGRLAYIGAGTANPGEVRVAGPGYGAVVVGAKGAFAGPTVTPRRVTFKATDGLTIHGQLFETAGAAKGPAIVFVHGGPMRQMLLGFPYMDYYAHAYAVNQVLASRGFRVLSVNYRLGIGYGRAFQHPEGASFAGAAEYRDVQAAAKYLQALPGVDPARIGIWGGSYGGYLTALALARDSATFKAGVDLHGVHDWSRTLAEETKPADRHEKGDWEAALKTAFESSPVASVAGWRSPVLLIHGDDDRNVRFNQTIDLANRLGAAGVRYEELVLPNEIHGFLRYGDWVRVDAATVRFFERELGR